MYRFKKKRFQQRQPRIELDIKPLRKLRAQNRVRKLRATRHHQMKQVMVRGKNTTSSGSLGYSLLVILGVLAALTTSRGLLSNDETVINPAETIESPLLQTETKQSHHEIYSPLRRKISLAQLPMRNSMRNVNLYSRVKNLDTKLAKKRAKNTEKAYSR